jgi:translation initiation factor IF-2
MSEGSIRIKKAATEFNISVSHVVEHLSKKGFTVENNPNAKITEEMYGVLLRDFGQDKKIKEQAAQISIGRQSKSDVVLDTKEFATAPAAAEKEQEEVLIKGLNTAKAAAAAPAEEKPVTAAPKVEKEEAPELPVVPAEKPAAPVAVVEQKEVPPVAEVPVPEAPPAKAEVTPEPAPEQPAAKSEAPTADASGPKVLRTIDLDALNKNKQRPQQSNQRPNTPKPEAPKAPEQPKPKVAEVAPKAEEAPNTEKPLNEEDEAVIRAKADRLQGTTVLGKIDLTQFEKRKPVASSSDDAAARRKRKRKDGTVPGQPATGNAPAQGTGGGNRDNRPAGQGGNNRGPNQGGNNRPGGGGGNNRPGGNNRNDRGGLPQPKAEPTEKEIQDQIKATMARLQGGNTRGRGKLGKKARFERDNEGTEQESGEKIKLQVTEFLTTGELAQLMDVAVGDVIMNCFSLGLVVTINQRLDAETITLVADEFGYDISFISAVENEPQLEEESDPENLKPRAPIVTIMGHVDHGKTSLLDFIRKTNVIAGEAGGITQHIGAYEVKLKDGKSITFLDTPGHEAFTAMRARGAKVTDIVVIVIAADDSVMPQTKEAISHAQAAGVPIVFAINKIDRPEANAERIREQLSMMNILVESWGGKYQDQEISAKKGLNVDLLLEKVLLEAELLELKADPSLRASGTIIESSLDKGRGVVATVLIENGTIRMGDPILAGAHFGKVKALQNERGQKIQKAGPAQPVQILGFNSSPTAGDKFYVTENDAVAKEIGTRRQQLIREQGMRTKKHITLDEIGRRLAIGNFKELNLIVKGDVDGSVEALSDSLMKLSTDQIQVNVIHKGVGQISESDVMLASASDAIIIGFQVRPLASVRRLAEQEEIDIRTYSIIYDAIEEIKSAMEGMLAPTYEEKVVCNVEIRETFKISKVGTIAGCMVLDGKINRNTKVRVLRDGVVIHTGELASLKRYKDDVKEVNQGYECGLNINNFNDIQVGDIIEGYERVEVKAKL